ncbi:peptidase, partial [Xanthomonas perforans]|nr:peptidase [Xanthomonas perforans]
MLLQWMIFPARTRCQTDADQRVERASRCDAVAALATSAGYARPASTSCNAVRSAIAPACKPQQNSTHAPPGDGSAYARRLSQPLAPMSHTKTSTLALALLVALAGCQREAQTSSRPEKTATSAPAATADAKPAFDIGELDAATNACQNLDDFVNGRWKKANPIPADRTSWGVSDVLVENSLTTQRQIAEDAARQADTQTNPVAHKIGMLYA